ncbi:MAG: hypothetical protein ABI183_05825 [Polyangiaceae bacterium]
MKHLEKLARLGLFLAVGCGGQTTSPAHVSARIAAPAASSAAPTPPPLVDGWLEIHHPNYVIRVRPKSHASDRLNELTTLVDAELMRTRRAMGISPTEGNGIVIYFHDSEEKGGPTHTRAFASWNDDGEISAHFLIVADFDDRTELLRSLVANELVKATTFAALRRSPTDHIDKQVSALAWLMEGSGELLHTGGWFGRDVDALMIAFAEGGLDYPIPKILASDYTKAWTFNRRTTHTFNIVEFPEMASFTRYLWQAFEPSKYTTLLREIRARGDDGAVAAFQTVYGTSLDDLEKRWRATLKDSNKRDASIDVPRLTRVVHEFVAVLETSARALTFDNAAVKTWAKKYTADIAAMPLIKLDLDVADAALTRAQSELIADLKASAPLVEKGMGITISLPLHKNGKIEVLDAGPVTATAISPRGLGAKRGLQKGDEIHLLDTEIYAAVEASPKKPYDGVLRVTRAGESKAVVLNPEASAPTAKP